MSKKPSFANLGTRLAQKTVDTPVPAPPERKKKPSSKAATGSASKRQRPVDDRRGILVRARPEAWKALKQVALDESRTLQDLMTEAINDVLTKNGKSPLA